ncbi:type I polyketide synthase [Nonomuraea polychroma]|uniref:type I polyketide synthase n=1 Tax=Nonomuraea polychroma TaxID=46176 RepID=UPI003D92F86A
MNGQESGITREQAWTEPIAVIGIGCRLPKAEGPDALWQLLRTGSSSLGPAPADRWSTSAEADTGPRRGGFLDEVGHFDAGFFGISPREVITMDPQQRIMLELVWEALEDARIVPATLHGSQTGVFAGSLRDDYTSLIYQHGSAAITPETMTGTSRGVIANRVSYHLGLRGPSVTVDAAQASSLVAVHLAAESIRSGESATAIAAGVNLNLLAESAIAEERFGGLSPDGECYTFDGRANGFVRGEGGAAVVLKPLQRALADGDRVYGVIRGSAVNNDGATPGLTVPSAEAQERVLRQAYERARLSPEAVQYVELHGTGTPVGDPIEAAALGAALGSARRPDAPLLVGSVKTNVGHLEGAAGIIGLLKVLLSLHHKELPPSRNFAAPNPRIPLAALNLSVHRELTPWPCPEQPLVAGVSSFGMGGTNCHVVLEEAPSAPAPSPEPRENRVLPWVLSARTSDALAGQAERLLRMTAAAAPAEVAGHGAPDPVDVAHSLLVSRTAFEHRAVVLGRDRAEFAAGLRALARGEIAPNVVRGTGLRRAGERVVFVFPGQGHQWAGMAVELWDTAPTFARRMAECEQALAEYVDWSLEGVLRGDPAAPSLDRVDVVQPVLFAVMVSLAELWRSHGVQPVAVVGHSQGEIAAACVAGALSLRDAARVVALRSQVIATAVSGRGGMASLSLSSAEASRLIAEWDDRLSLATINGPASVVVAGDVDALEELLARCEAEGVQARRVAVDYASHSAHVEALRDPLAEVLGELAPMPSSVPFHSTVTAGLLEGPELNADYWYRNLRQTVRFEETVSALLRDGDAVFVEMSAHPMLLTGIEQTAEARDREHSAAIGTLRRDEGGLDQFLAAVAAAYTHGVPVEWDIRGGALIDLPTYAFQRKPYWVGQEPLPTMETSSALARRLATADPRERRQAVLELVRSHAAAILGHTSPEAVEADRTFKDLGFDSRMTVELRNTLNAATGLRLPTSVLFDHPTPAHLTRHLEAQVAGVREVIAPPSTPVRSGEPIAIVGMACRYPGDVHSPEDLWQLVERGIDAITDFPADRGWRDDLYNPDPERSGTSYVRLGGFLRDAGMFDADFFGISPREALAMDPQQRLLLETAWEAVERAGIDAGSLRGSRTGVFVGATALEYGPRMDEPAEGVEGHLLAGNAASVMSGRIAYQLGLTGPAITVDTACSSSLVALHAAIGSLRSGESTLALAGGVAVMSTPGMFVEFSRQRGLAPDGRCKPFSAAADGTAWAEGVGLLLLERVSDARRNGHPILAVIRGSAVNQDGASNGLTAPNGPSQQRVIRAALADAGLAATEVDAVEAHGTGTALGDPIEAEAIIATYGSGRADDRPVFLGSLKSNIGHAQAAAGVGGVIKMVQAMRHGTLPRTLHVDRPTDGVDWTAGAVELLTESRPWPLPGRPRRAAISSFGISGTNAHVIIEQAPAEERPETRHGGPVAWLLSGKTPQAVRDQAARLATHVRAHPQMAITDVAYTLAACRTAHEQRSAVIGQTTEELLAGLDTLAQDALPIIQAPPRGPVTFLFTGQGSQHPGMGRHLYATHPVFAQALDTVLAELDPHLDQPLKPILFADPDSPQAELLNQTRYTQPALFAYQTALFQLLRSFGITPDYLIGHSLGEISAAHAAGILTLTDAARLVAARAQLMASAPPGAMISIHASQSEVAPTLAGYSDVAIAATNTPTMTVISGNAETVTTIAEHWQAQGRRTRPLPGNHAFHSPNMDPILDDFRKVAASLTYHPATIPLISTLTGQQVDTVDADYWTNQIRQPVHFHQALQAAPTATYMEIGPDTTLTTLTRATLPDATTIPVNDQTPTSFMAALATAHTHNIPITWPTGQPTNLPTYPFQHKRYWLTPVARGTARDLGLDVPDHPFLAAAMELAGGQEVALAGRLSLADHPWLADHVISGAVLVPGTAFLELVTAAARHANARVVEELALETPLVLDERQAVRIQVTVGAPQEDGDRPFTVYSRPDDESRPWTRHVTGVLSDRDVLTRAEGLAQWPPAGAVAEPLTGLYSRLADLGYEYGPAFQLLESVWRSGDELFAEVRMPEPGSYGIHPALLDASLHPLVAAGSDPGTIRLPFAWSGVRVLSTGAATLRVRLTPTGADAVTLSITDESGAPVAAVESLSLRQVAKDQLAQVIGDTDGLSTVTWRAVTLPDRTPPNWAEVSGEDGLADAAGAELVVVRYGVAGPHSPDAAHAQTGQALGLLQRWLADDAFAGSRLAFVTTHAIAALPGDDVTDLSNAALWGLVRSAQSEHPDRIILVDLDYQADDEVMLRAATAGEPQVVVRGGVLYVPRLTRMAASPVGGGAEFDPEGTVLITGGTGGLGALFAEHLVTRHDVRRLVLASRRGPDAPGAARLRERLSASGATVDIVAADVSDRDTLAALLGDIPAEHPLTAVVHAAGTLDDATTESLTLTQLAAVLRPKMDAAWHLHELTKHDKLSAFIMFSSISGIIGMPGQAGYAAANSYLDALAAHRTATGLAGTSIAWGLWGGAVGMGAELDSSGVARWARAGVAPLAPVRGPGLFDAAMATSTALVVPADLSPARAQTDSPPMLRELVRAQRQKAQPDAAEQPWHLQVTQLPREEWLAAATDLVRSHTASVLGHASASAVDVERTFLDLGLDSLTGVELRNHLNTATGLRLPTTIVFDHPTPTAMATYLHQQLAKNNSPAHTVLQELTRLETLIANTPADDTEQITTRLRHLLDLCEGHPTTTPHDDLDTASDGELFAFVDGLD